MIDIQAYHQKLVNHETIPNEDVSALLVELTHFRKAAGYLASCHAATLEGLPKSTSKSQRSRYLGLCQVAGQLLDGDASGIRYPLDLQVVRERCLKAIEAAAK